VFDPNTRPDPYCAANILLRRFALEGGQVKEFEVFDTDNSGQGFAAYRVRLEHLGKKEVAVPAGRFAANHLRWTQLTSADTWFKKRAGHVTDFWVLDNGVIVRILRHREPYEVLLAEYNSAEPRPGLLDPAVAQVKHDLEILNAQYGAQDQWVEVTEHLNNRIRDGALVVKASNDIAGDPIDGVAKELRVQYRLDGKTLTKSVQEEDTLRIPEDAGAFEPASYESDLIAFLAEADATYPFFDLKGIRGDWEDTKAELSEKVETCQSNTEFLGLALEAIRCLRDGHMWVEDAKAELPPFPKQYCPSVSFMPATENRVVVMRAWGNLGDTLKPGAVITKIDGEDARAFLEARAAQAWAEGGFISSPQRARMFEFRMPLKGNEGDKRTLAYISDGNEQELEVTCDTEARGWPHTYNLPSGMTRVGRSFWYTQLADGAGYMYVRRIDASTEPGMREAVEKYPDATGWIVDLCGNSGGGYGRDLIERMAALPRPVAVIIDAGCVSAGETVARDLRREAGARVFGSKTAGSSTSKRTWPFPSGIASVRFSTRSRWRNDGQPIEFNGIDPDVAVEAVPEEVAQGLNSAVCRAQEYLAKERVKAEPR